MNIPKETCSRDRDRSGPTTDRLRICISIGTLGTGGIGRVMVGLGEQFVKMGHEVDLVLTSTDQMGREKELPSEFNVIELGSRSRYALPSSVRYLRKRRPHLVLTARHNVNFLMLLAHRLSRVGSRVRIVCTFRTHHSTDIRRNSWRGRLHAWLALKQYKRADGLVAISRGVAEDIEKAARLKAGSVKVIYNPAWSERRASQAQEPCNDLWLSDERIPVVMGVGRLVEQKDFLTLIKAFKELRKRRVARLIILGEGRERRKLEALISELSLSEDVRLPGHVANPLPMLAKAKVFVLSSSWEGFGNVIVEALGCGTAVVATDCPSGPREILNNGEYGMLVPVGSSKEMANAIQAQMDSPLLRDELRKRAEDFLVDRIAQQYLHELMEWRAK